MKDYSNTSIQDIENAIQKLQQEDPEAFEYPKYLGNGL